ncbi:molybdopterin-synthase adenylyltransferase MoeB [Sutterella sp.]|uniref:molybdopterin-synthase adenylyltransferase MoeB n=1 Tax=Sutterella sp. TaxID=1981025 RepID=UPI0026DF192D|nr:molybdopterin-synthase adenylyltransferase MoeB [Sutterella sp.]MDO5532765.1 molybdopterin-synthase adenylyltransferase MoeB [Sutterella sp.]
MTVRILIPATLRGLAGREREAAVEARTAREALERLAEIHPALRPALFTDAGEVQGFLNLFVGSKSLEEIGGPDALLPADAEILLVPAISGGSGATDAPAEVPAEKVTLGNDEILRYSRQLLLREVGVKGQKKLKAAKVLIIGCGGLGAPLALYLASAGVGTLGLLDFDLVDETNLQRQVIHGTRDVGRPKAASARDSVRAINPKVKTVVHQTRLTKENALEIISQYDIVADATDNFVARYLISDACVLAGKPDVFGGIYQTEGQAGVFDARRGGCWRCLYPSPPPAGVIPSCAEGGVIGSLAGLVGSIQATEVIKLIVGAEEPLIGRLILIDAWRMKFHEFRTKKNPACPICGEHPTITRLEEIDYEEFCGLHKADEDGIPIDSITAKELRARLDRGDRIELIDVREPHERAIAKFPGAKWIPVGQLARRRDELDPEADLIFLCREGKRSILAARTIIEAGWRGRCLNLEGGIDEWAREVDPSMPRY